MSRILSLLLPNFSRNKVTNALISSQTSISNCAILQPNCLATVQDLKEKAQQIESALPKAGRTGLKSAAERAEELDESESASEEDDADADGESAVRKQVRGRLAPTLGLTAAPAIARAKVKGAKKVEKDRVTVKGQGRTETQVAAPGSPRPSSATAKGSVSKKDKENEHWLEQISGDETMFQVAKKHLASDTGSSIKCLAQLNLPAFFATPKMGQTLNGVIASDWGNFGHRKTSL